MSWASRLALAAVALLAACSGSQAGGQSQGAAAKRKSTIGAHPKALAADAGQAPSDQDAGPAIADAGTSDLSSRADPPPTNVSFETARKVEPGARGVWQTRHSETQVDYFAFEATAGSFYVMTTDVNPFSPDNTISLYDSDRNQIAQNDDGSMWPGDKIDARLVVRLQLAGAYFVRIEDRTQPIFDSSAPLPYYQFTLNAVDHATAGFAFASEPGAEPTAVELVDDQASGFAFVTLLGEMSADATDVFALTGRSQHVLDGEILASGMQGNGSTAVFQQLQVASTEPQVVARIERAQGQHNIHPPVTDGAYRLSLTADGDPGTNGFYAIDLALLPDNPSEQAESQNDELGGAEPITMTGSFSRRGLLLSRLPPGDVDYYSFELRAGEYVQLACEGESGGSGVRGLQAEVRDDKDQTLASALESPDSNLSIDELRIAATGTHYLRLSSMTTVQADVAEPWARCVVFATP